MKKLLLTIILSILCLGVFAPVIASAQNQPTPEQTATLDANKGTAPNRAACLSWFELNLDACMADVGNLIMWLMGLLVYITGHILDLVLVYTTHMSELIDKIKVVDIGWTIFRDVANMLFIFILLWVAVTTILGLQSGETKRMLMNVILAALLINFSLFFTKALIDASNIFTLHFYNLITNDGQGSVSAAFMEGLDIQAVYDSSVSNSALTSFSSVGKILLGTALGGPLGLGGVLLSNPKIIIMTIMGSILMLVTAFVFFAAAVMFMLRTVVLIFLMILSPLAFMGHVLPAMEHYASEWWGKLIKNLLFAPLYMVLAYIVVAMVQSPGFKDVMKVDANALGSGIESTITSSFSVFITFIVLIFMMVGCLLIASEFGAKGSETMMSWGGSLAHWGQGAVTGFAGKHLIGRPARILNEKWESWVPKSGLQLQDFSRKISQETKEGKAGLYKQGQGMVAGFLGKSINAFGGTGILGDTLRQNTVGAAEHATYGGSENALDYHHREKQLQVREDAIKQVHLIIGEDGPGKKYLKEVGNFRPIEEAWDAAKKAEKAAQAAWEADKANAAKEQVYKDAMADRLTKEKTYTDASESMKTAQIATEEAVMRIAPDVFGHLTEEMFEEHDGLLMRFATNAQVRALMKNEDYSQAQKDEWLYSRYKADFEAADKYDEAKGKYEKEYKDYQYNYEQQREIFKQQGQSEDSIQKAMNKWQEKNKEPSTQSFGAMFPELYRRWRAADKDDVELAAFAKDPRKPTKPGETQRPGLMRRAGIVQTIRMGTLGEIRKSKMITPQTAEDMRYIKMADIQEAADLYDGIDPTINEAQKEVERKKMQDYDYATSKYKELEKRQGKAYRDELQNRLRLTFQGKTPGEIVAAPSGIRKRVALVRVFNQAIAEGFGGKDGRDTEDINLNLRVVLRDEIEKTLTEEETAFLKVWRSGKTQWQKYYGDGPVYDKNNNPIKVIDEDGKEWDLNRWTKNWNNEQNPHNKNPDGSAKAGPRGEIRLKK
jgi:hypothetical protein